MANEQLPSNNLHKSPGLQGIPQMEYSNPTLSDIRQQQTDTNSAQQYQTSNKDWDSLHQVQHGPPGTSVSGLITASGINSTQGLVNESLATMPPQRTVTSGGNTDLSAMTGSNLGQYAVKLPPGFGGVSNGTSSNTSNGDFNNRTSFSHVPDNAPVAIGYGRSNSISVIPQSAHVEESLTYQQTQSLYGPSFGHSFLPTSPPRANKNNSGFGGAYENTYLEATIKNSLSALAENDDHDWEKVIRTPVLEDSPKKESVVYKPLRSATLPSQSEINNSVYSATNIVVNSWTPSTSSFASQNLTNLQSAPTHALNNTGGYFPPQLQQANDQYSSYNGGMFGPNIRRTSTVNNVQGNGIIHDDSAHAKFDHGLGGPLDYYDPANPAGTVTPSSPTSYYPQQQVHFPFRSFGNALQQPPPPQSQQSQQQQPSQQQLQIQLLQQQQQQILQQQHHQQLQIQKQQQQQKQKQAQANLASTFRLPSWSTSVSSEDLQRRRLDRNGDDTADDVVTGSMALYDPSNDDIILPQRDVGKFISGNESKDFGHVELKLDIRGLQTPIMTVPPGLEGYRSPTSPRSSNVITSPPLNADHIEQYLNPTLAGLTSPTIASVNSVNQNILLASVREDMSGNVTTNQTIVELTNTLNNMTIAGVNGSVVSEIGKVTSPVLSNVQVSGSSVAPKQAKLSWAAIAKTAPKPPPVNTSPEVLGTVAGAYSAAISPSSAVSPTSAYARPMSAPTGAWVSKAKIVGTPSGNGMSNLFVTPNPGLVTPTGMGSIAMSSAQGVSKKDMITWIAAKGYNPKSFNCKPIHARFFVIKSYTEDDVHKSLKYDIWASTEIGNRRLDKAFRESADKGPIYLFFSVNASGHFCGMAEMLTPVDYTTSSSVWAQDKWKGVFKVKWIFVKDIPNGQLRHIRVVNNENKPVTNSRDTQELFPDPGREMLKIFFEYRSKTSILDDFEFYDKRQVEMRKDGIAPLVGPTSPGVVTTNPYANIAPLSGTSPSTNIGTIGSSGNGSVDSHNDDSDNN